MVTVFVWSDYYKIYLFQTGGKKLAIKKYKK